MNDINDGEPFYDFGAVGLGDGIFGEEHDTDEKMTHLIKKVNQLEADLAIQKNTNSSLLAKIAELEFCQDPNTSPGKRLRSWHDGAGPSNIHDDTVFPSGQEDDFDINAIDNLPDLDDDAPLSAELQQQQENAIAGAYAAIQQQAPVELQQPQPPVELQQPQVPAELLQPQVPAPDRYVATGLYFLPHTDPRLDAARAAVFDKTLPAEIMDTIELRMEQLTRKPKSPCKTRNGAIKWAMGTNLKHAFRGLKPFLAVRANRIMLESLCAGMRTSYTNHWESMGLSICDEFKVSDGLRYKVPDGLRKTIAHDLIAVMIAFHDNMGLDLSIPYVSDAEAIANAEAEVIISDSDDE